MSLLKISAVLTLAAALIGGTSACNPGASSNANTTISVNKAAANNTNAVAAATEANPTTSADSLTAVEAGTPTAAYVAAYNARKNKDVAALKKLMSKDILEFFDIVADADSEGGKKKSVDDVLMELCLKPQAPTSESRNEKIKGDKATLEYPDEKGEWKTMDFEKENGMWKLAAPSADGPGDDMKSDDKGGKKK